MAPELQTAGQHGCNATEQRQHWGSSERNSVGLGNLSFTQRQDTATSILAVPPLLPCSHWVPKAPCISKGMQRNPPPRWQHTQVSVCPMGTCASFTAFKGQEIAPNLGRIAGTLLAPQPPRCTIQILFSQAEQEGTVASMLHAGGSALFPTQQNQHSSPSPA